MVIKGLSIHIAIFHSQSRTGGGAYSRDKNTCAGTLAENGRGGLYARGGVLTGYYGTSKKVGLRIPGECTRIMEEYSCQS